MKISSFELNQLLTQLNKQAFHLNIHFTGIISFTKKEKWLIKGKSKYPFSIYNLLNNVELDKWLKYAKVEKIFYSEIDNKYCFEVEFKFKALCSLKLIEPCVLSFVLGNKRENERIYF